MTPAHPKNSSPPKPKAIELPEDTVVVSTESYAAFRQSLIAKIRLERWRPWDVAEELSEHRQLFPEIDSREIDCLRDHPDDWAAAHEAITQAFPSRIRQRLELQAKLSRGWTSSA